jgi:hypothetical protein
MHSRNCVLLTLNIDRKIKELWEDPDQTEILTIRKLIQTTLVAVLQAPLTTKQHWVTIVEMAEDFKICIQTQTDAEIPDRLQIKKGKKEC